MEKRISAIICTCDLDNGYIFKNYFVFNSLRGRPIITITDSKIIAGNCTADNELYGGGYLHGDEINLIWDPEIPVELRELSLTFDTNHLQTALSKIRKKDPARITIAQNRDMNDPYKFDGDGSSPEFIIYLSCGVGGDGREGLKAVPALRTNPLIHRVKYPKISDSFLLIIPVRQFRSMIESFSKCKKESILIRIHPNLQTVNGKEIRGRPGFVITTEGTSQFGKIFEKFGEVLDEDNNVPATQFNNLKIDESSIVRVTTSLQPIIEIENIPKSNEYIINADKIGIFTKMASMHNEGSVRIRYQQGYHLHISYRFGAFGEIEICLYNQYVT
jgi:hypothetical protein